MCGDAIEVWGDKDALRIVGGIWNGARRVVIDT
jgi:hypothetical protein